MGEAKRRRLAAEAVELRPGLPEPPVPIRLLPRDERGYPIPWFVAYPDGKPDFRVADGRKLAQAVKHRLCWICGRPLHDRIAFVVGPMCAVNRVSAEPPQHADCARFSARVCPFLIHPKAKRREVNVPDGVVDPAGLFLRRNPGVALVWITRGYSVSRLPDGFLFNMGNSTSVEWYAEGRPATRAEVLESIESGLPALQQIAEEEGLHSVARLRVQLSRALALIPNGEDAGREQASINAGGEVATVSTLQVHGDVGGTGVPERAGEREEGQPDGGVRSAAHDGGRGVLPSDAVGFDGVPGGESGAGGLLPAGEGVLRRPDAGGVDDDGGVASSGATPSAAVQP